MSRVADELHLAALTRQAWKRRLTAAIDAARDAVPESLRPLHAAVTLRARASGAHTLILSGSTARRCRTEISDLDYHLVGETPIETGDLSPELDLHILTPRQLTAAICDGDDFIQWSLRFGLVIFDDGTALKAARLIAEQRPWPDVRRKAAHAAKSLELASRVVETGDADGALIQVRTALSLAARTHMLSRGQFPLSRAELPAQLEAVGRVDAARALEACIYGEPSLEALSDAVAHGCSLLAREGAIAP